MYRQADDQDYRGEHQAPTNNGYNRPLYDVVPIYPDDIYSYNGARYYGTGEPCDSTSIQIIQQCRNKPNSIVKIFRAVPYSPPNREVIQDYEALKREILHRGKMPVGVQGYRNVHDYYNWLSDEITRLQQLSEVPETKYKISAGDWVTICRQYAVDHGHGALNGKFKILTKQVHARDLWTDGNSPHEWGYDPQAAIKIQKTPAGR
jgi:hypothetical protein